MKIRFVTAALIILSQTAFSQWDVSSSVNTSVAVTLLDQQEVRVTSDGKGGAIVASEDFRNNLSFADIFAQRLDKNGIPKWTF